jgi:hypothetical protein
VWERRGEWRIMEDRRGKVRKRMDVPLHVLVYDILPNITAPE